MRRALRLFLLLAALVAVPSLGLAYEEQSLLTPDGTLHVVRTGRAVDLGITDQSFSPSYYVVEWTSRAQDGTLSTALIPGTISSQEKRGLQLAYDEPTGKLVLLWIEEVSAYSYLRLGVLQNGTWTNSPLLPTQGITHAFNPQMRITHLNVTYLDANDATVALTSSVLSVIWWEEAHDVMARYATVFLDEDRADPSSLGIYDLPALAGDADGTSSSYGDAQPASYLYPNLQTDGFSGGLFASFADLHDRFEKVIRIDFPRDRGKPSEPGNLKWERRHAPIVNVALTGPLFHVAPIMADADSWAGVGTSIGGGYKPTFYWREGDALKFSRLDSSDWSPVRAIAIDDTTTYEQARDLVVSMGQRN